MVALLFLLFALFLFEVVGNSIHVDVVSGGKLTSSLQRSNPSLFAHTQRKGDQNDENQRQALHRDQMHPYGVGVLRNHRARATQRATPGHHVHHRRRQCDDRQQHIPRHVQRLVQRQQRRNR